MQVILHLGPVLPIPIDLLILGVVLFNSDDFRGHLVHKGIDSKLFGCAPPKV